MATQYADKLFIEEKLIYGGLVYTYPIYFLGGLYVTGSVIGWMVFAIVLLRAYILPDTVEKDVPVMVWIWVAGMLAMLVALWLGHSNWFLGTAKTIKSTVGWAKGWALIALFIFLGAFANIQPKHVIRGVCIIGYHTLIFAVITFIVSKIGIPGEIYISPLQAVGGPGPNFFTVSLYGMNPETGAARWQFFGPWSPAAGLIACLFFIISCAETDPVWRKRGIAGFFAMCLLSQSRAGWAIFIMLIPMIYMGNKVRQPWFLFTAGFLFTAVLTLGEPLYELIMSSYEDVKNARPESTRVRNTLASLAIQRWQSEAFWFGHGIVEPGPKIVEGMPIGSHHSWYGLLFVKGLVGMLALLIPMIVTAVYLFSCALYYPLARMAFYMLCVISGYSFFENLEILSYLYWPALLIIGMSFNVRKLLTYDKENKGGSLF